MREKGDGAGEELEMYVESVGSGGRSRMDETAEDLLKGKVRRVLAMMGSSGTRIVIGNFTAVLPDGFLEMWVQQADGSTFLAASGFGIDKLEDSALRTLSAMAGAYGVSSWEELEMFLESLGKSGDFA